ncbi:MAG: DUF6273 domain-containing protein [Treponema sp.]|jgi:hypothetical protein|nr:DUF6273 domain-containing protein [Treponema sp.]
MSVATKLEYLKETKDLIKSAIQGKGVAVPDGATFRAYAGKVSEIVGVAVEVWNVTNSPVTNPGTGIGGISWQDPLGVEFDHIGIYENGAETAHVAAGAERWEPPEGNRQFTIKIVFSDGRTSVGYQLPLTDYRNRYDAVLASATIPLSAPRTITLQFDNYVHAVSAAGITIGGMTGSVQLLDQPDSRTVRLSLPEGIFRSGKSYTVNYNAAQGDITLSDGSALPSISLFPADNNSAYSPAAFVGAEIPANEPSTLVLLMSRAVSVASVAGFALANTTAQIRSVISDGATVEFELTEPVDAPTAESDIKLSFTGEGATDDFGFGVPAFANQEVDNYSENEALSILSAEVPASDPKSLILVMTGAVQMTSGAGFTVTGDQAFDLSGCPFLTSDGTIKFVLPQGVNAESVLALAYDGSGTLKSAGGDTIHAFTKTIVNNSTGSGSGGGEGGGTIPAGSGPRDLGIVVLGKNPATAAEVRQVLEAVHRTVEAGLIGNLAEGDHIIPQLSASLAFTVSAGYDSGGGITMAVNPELSAEHGYYMEWVIVGKNSYKGKNGNTYDHVVFQSRNVLGYESETNGGGHYMNPGNDNTTGYLNCKMRQYLLENMVPALKTLGIPFEESWMKAPARKVSRGGTAAEPGADVITDKLFLPTEYEMTGSNTYSNADAERAESQGRLGYYDSNAKRVKYNKDNAARIYWEASPYSGNSASFCNINASGAANSNSASYVRGIAPAFCVA